MSVTNQKKKNLGRICTFQNLTPPLRFRNKTPSPQLQRRQICDLYSSSLTLFCVSVFWAVNTFLCVCVCLTQKQVEMCPSTKQRPGFSHPTAVPPRKINSSPVVVCSSACVYMWECVFKSTFFNCHNSFYNIFYNRVRLMNWHVLLSSSSCRYSPTCDCTRWIHVVGESFVFRHSKRLTRLRAREGETWKTAGLRREGPSE